MKKKLSVLSVVIATIPVAVLLATMSGCTGMTCKNHGCSERELASYDEHALSEEEEADRLREKMSASRSYSVREKKNQSN